MSFTGSYTEDKPGKLFVGAWKLTWRLSRPFEFFVQLFDDEDSEDIINDGLKQGKGPYYAIPNKGEVIVFLNVTV